MTRIYISLSSSPSKSKSKSKIIFKKIFLKFFKKNIVWFKVELVTWKKKI